MSSESSERDRNSWQGEATVDEEIMPNKVGRVKFRGSYWNARCEKDATLVPGQAVQVVGRDNITLLVEPVPFCEYEAIPDTP